MGGTVSSLQKRGYIVTHLGLHIRNLLRGEAELIERHLRFLQVAEEAQFTWEEEHETFAGIACTSSTPNPVDIISRIVWWVVLNDPVDSGNIKSSRCDVCAEEDSGLGVAEFQECGSTLLLLLVSLRLSSIRLH